MCVCVFTWTRANDVTKTIAIFAELKFRFIIIQNDVLTSHVLRVWVRPNSLQRVYKELLLFLFGLTLNRLVGSYKTCGRTFRCIVSVLKSCDSVIITF